MTPKEKYLQDRAALMEQAQNFANAGNMEEFMNVKAKIEELDTNFENAAQLQTEMEALNKANKIANLQDHSAGVSGTVMSSTSDSTLVEANDITNSVEYRKAFMNFVTNKTPMPDKFRNAAQEGSTQKADAGVLIPTVILERVIEKLETAGIILSRVTRTNFKAGVAIPKSTIKPVAEWVGEGTKGKRQKKVFGSINFSSHKLRCAISMSLEVEVLALSVFERNIMDSIAEAMLMSIEEGIIYGTGEGQPTGILSDKTEVVAGQSIGVTDITYDVLLEADAAVPTAYDRDAEWFMTKKTFTKFLGIKDADGQPIARVSVGLDGKPERVLLGRRVVENDYMPHFTEAEADEVFAFIFNMKDYAFNTAYATGITEYYDNDTEEKIKKAVMLADGNVLDNNSLVVLKKETAKAVATKGGKGLKADKVEEEAKAE